jgi:AmmeMemoRadiSam system protein A
MFTYDEKRDLIKIARFAISELLGLKHIEDYPDITKSLSAYNGVFVTLRNKSDLRGCIGLIESEQPLYATVAEMAKSAASRDSRFPPVSVEELEYIDIEISVLSLLKTIVDIREIVVGDHGLLIRRMSYQGLLLPQVAIENSWNRETFLINTCRKAGLPDDAWKDDSTTIQIFTAEFFCDF